MNCSVRLIWGCAAQLFLICFCAAAQSAIPEQLCGHSTVLDPSGGLLAWHKPETPGAAYSHVSRLAAEFIKSATPVDEKTGLKMYFVTCCFQGPHLRSEEDWKAGRTGEAWMHNPACVFAGAVQSLALQYRVYSGDPGYLNVVRQMLDYQLDNGTTPPDWSWPSVPYASSDPFSKIYQGATKWEHEGMRGDGLHGLEPDKIGELGYGYLSFYQVTGEEKYLQAALNCADALAKNVRDLVPDPSPFSQAGTDKSPWPFRVNARTGVILSDYCSNVVDPIRLLDELLRIGARIGLSSARSEAYARARQLAWRWLYSKNGPIQTGLWNAYFEDIPNDPERTNRVQITPLELAKYLIRKPELDPHLDRTVPALVHWVRAAFGDQTLPAIKEQTWCYEAMGSHSARYAAVCAMWYERTGDEWYKEQAFRHFNYATYMTYENGVVAVGHNWPGSWFSDGYSDYIRHFMDGLAAVPEWAPQNENRLLGSSSAVVAIEYGPRVIRYRTFDGQAVELLRLTAKPVAVTAGGQPIGERGKLEGSGWTWQPLSAGGILRIQRHTGHEVVISFGPTSGN